MNSIVYTYASFVRDGIAELKQIPEAYRDDVYEYLQNGEPESEVDVPVDEIYGALYLPPIDDITIDTSILGLDSSVEVSLSTSSIFTEDMLDNNPYPQNVFYEITRVENSYGRLSDVNAWLAQGSDGFAIHIKGTPHNITPGIRILRVDLTIMSTNYEPMRQTLYIHAQ